MPGFQQRNGGTHAHLAMQRRMVERNPLARGQIAGQHLWHCLVQHCAADVARHPRLPCDQGQRQGVIAIG
ncbi:hypothetical protein D3C72_2161100 [compost metagenome]